MDIYLITNSVNGHRYVGKTNGAADKRFRSHLRSAASGSDTILYRAIRKYGPDAFTVSVLEEAVDLNAAEIKWIADLNPEYNMTKGGDGGDTSASPKYQASRAAHSDRMKGSGNPFYGKKHNPETIERLRQIALNRPPDSPETRRKKSLAMMGRVMSPEQIAANVERQSKIYYLIDPEGNPVTIKNLSEHCRKHGLDQGNMTKMYQGKYNASKGWKKQ
jgi:group I intron endonuclease